MTDRQYKTRITRLVVLPEGEPLFSELATSVEIDDESGGEYIVLRQAVGEGVTRINPEEWPALKEAVDKMIKECRTGDAAEATND